MNSKIQCKKSKCKSDATHEYIGEQSLHEYSCDKHIDTDNADWKKLGGNDR